MELPELPEPSFAVNNVERIYYTADQMRDYARAYVRAEREACAQVCDERSRWIAGVIVPGLPEQFRGADSFANGSWQEAESCAAAIRARSEQGKEQG